MEFYKILNISKKEFFFNKHTNIQYSNAGNFIKNIKMPYSDYLKKYHKDILPVCLECGETVTYKQIGYWDRFYVICERYKHIKRNANTLNNKIKKHPNFSKYITFEYWIYEKNKKLSQAISIIKRLIYDNNIIKRLEDFDDKDKFIEQILKGEKLKLHGKHTISGWIQRGNNKSRAIKLQKQWIKSNHISIWTESYWTNKGYSQNEAKLQVKHIQQSNHNKKYQKYSIEEIRHQYTTCTEYWVGKGYSIEESKVMISNRQSTFSKKKCISKYGVKDGIERFNERQKKWQITLQSNPNIKNINRKKGKSFKKWISENGELNGRILFAKRYWKIDISSIEEFENYELFLHKGYTIKFKNSKFRLQILSEQNHKCGCPDCNSTNKDIQFHLHHIDYDKSNDYRVNLIFLCNKCHSKTTNCLDRKFWIDFYSKINTMYYNEKEI